MDSMQHMQWENGLVCSAKYAVERSIMIWHRAGLASLLQCLQQPSMYNDDNVNCWRCYYPSLYKDDNVDCCDYQTINLACQARPPIPIPMHFKNSSYLADDSAWCWSLFTTSYFCVSHICVSMFLIFVEFAPLYFCISHICVSRIPPGCT